MELGGTLMVHVPVPPAPCMDKEEARTFSMCSAVKIPVRGCKD